MGSRSPFPRGQASREYLYSKSSFSYMAGSREVPRGGADAVLDRATEPASVLFVQIAVGMVAVNVDRLSENEHQLSSVL